MKGGRWESVNRPQVPFLREIQQTLTVCSPAVTPTCSFLTQVCLFPANDRFSPLSLSLFEAAFCVGVTPSAPKFHFSIVPATRPQRQKKHIDCTANLSRNLNGFEGKKLHPHKKPRKWFSSGCFLSPNEENEGRKAREKAPELKAKL